MSFFTETHVPTIDKQQEALEAEREKLLASYETLRRELFNVEDALRRLAKRRHHIVYGKRETAA